MSNVFSRVVRQEGVTSLWKGFTPYILRVGPHTILTFVVLEQLNRWYSFYILGDRSGKTKSVNGVELAPGHRLTDLEYADDIALLASSFGDLQSMVSRVNEANTSVGLSINEGKTIVFSSCIPGQAKAPLEIDGCRLEEVDSFKYLGRGCYRMEIAKITFSSEIDAARWVFSSLLKCLWTRRDIHTTTKIRVCRASVRSVRLYGCKWWVIRVED
ncbi:unnamed protein product [Schistocephalus solidus]|uniref:Reverse transcriptase domain-containing protein n=1 Tax=Schistocephalus solidus TaxID=70667 RepID=A0A183T4V0_SCHSO|nr:unnamed protein product [Schistocephalus solidus]